MVSSIFILKSYNNSIKETKKSIEEPTPNKNLEGRTNMSVELDLNKCFDQAMDFYKSKKATIHQNDNEWPYVSIKDDPNGENIQYCAICFGSEGKLIPLMAGTCLVCHKR